MRRSRELTHADRWELGLFLSMLVVGCLCLAAIVNVGKLPRLFAAGENGQKQETAKQEYVAAKAKVEPVSMTAEVAPLTQELLPATPLIPVSPILPSPKISPAPKAKKATPPADIKWYKGEKYRYVRTLRLRVTAYSPDGRCCWPYPGTTTATGLSVKTNHGHLVAADPRVIPMHALVSVPGYDSGAAVPVLDQGGAIKGHRLDVMLPNFDMAKDWGSRVLDVKIYEPE